MQYKEEDIPLSARLASLADVYDALVCNRVYKAAMPYDEVLDIISSGRGTQFDPVLTDAVLHIHEEFKDISLKYK
jgi:putative two-component system response regulator